MQDQGGDASKVELVPVTEVVPQPEPQATGPVLQVVEAIAQTELHEPRQPAQTPASATLPSSRKDFEVLFAMFLISLGVFGLFTASESQFWFAMTNKANGQKIADLSSVNSGVRYRPAESLVWHDIGKKGQPLYDSDVIFTDENGKAEIALNKDGVVLEVDPNSLLVIKVQDGGALEVGKGSVRVRFSNKNADIKIKSQGKTYKISSQKEQVLQVSGSGDDEASPLLFIGSDVQVQDEKGSKVDIVQKQVELISPQSGENIVLMQQATAIRFRWKRFQVAQTKASKKLLLEIAGEQPQVIPISGAENSLEHPLRPGSYRWRISSNDSSGAKPETPWHTFSVQQLLPPTLIGPIDGYITSLSEKQNEIKISLQWKKVASNLKTEIEVGRIENQSSSSIKEASDAGYTAALTEGNFFWRVRTVDPQGRPSSWSEMRKLTVQNSRALALNQLVDSQPIVSPEEEKPVEQKPEPEPKKKLGYDFKAKDIKVSTALQSSNTYQIPVTLHWEAVKNAQSYSVVFLSPKGKKVSEQKAKTNKLEYHIESLDQDRMRYQVTAHLSGKAEQISNKARIHVVISAPKPKIPEEGRAFAQGFVVLFTWEKTVLARNYRIQIATSNDFEDPVVDKEKPGNLFTFEGASAGKYFWRVKGVAPGHQSEWSKPRSFQLK